MKGYNNSGRPFVDFEREGIIVFTAFETLKNECLIAAAKSRPHFLTAKIGGQRSVYRPGAGLELIGLYRGIMSDVRHKEHSLVKSLGVVTACEYLKFKYPSLYIGASCSIRTTPDGAYDGKHLAENCVDKPAAEHFDFLWPIIESWNIFEQYGRVVMFMNEHHSYTPIHLDWDKQDEFIWIGLTDKKFFVFDEATKTKHFAPGTMVTFNNSDYHGSDPNPYAALSLRIDGVFKPEVRAKLKAVTDSPLVTT